MGYCGDRKRAYQREWIARRRADWIDSQGGECVKCGSTDRLEVDHRDRTEKSLNPRSLWSMSPGNPRRVSELAKCQILCHDCHLEKSNDELRAHEHGSTMYRNGCRCDVCRLSQRLRARAYRAASRA